MLLFIYNIPLIILTLFFSINNPLYIFENIVFSNLIITNNIFEWLSVSNLMAFLAWFIMSYWCLFPEFILISFIVVLLLFGEKLDFPRFLVFNIICFMGLLIAFFILIIFPDAGVDCNFYFSHFYVFDFYTLVVKTVIFSFFVVFLCIIADNFILKKSKYIKTYGFYRAVYLLFLLFWLLSSIFISSYDLFGFYLLLEGLSFILIMFCVINFNNTISLLPALRYFCFNALASGCFLFSIAVFLGVFGSTNLFEIKYLSSMLYYMPNSLYLFISFFFIGCFFKLGCFPFNLWIILVYKSISYEVLFLFDLLFKNIFFFDG